ncbi:MAG: hypothetical protein PHW73_00405 [Atribacterota bacterium]|nr:hypothetical protein [Atribacterota bacterium]
MKAKEFLIKYWPVIALVGVGGYIIYARMKKNKIYKDLMNELAKPTVQYGTVKDQQNKAFSETWYKTLPNRDKLLILNVENGKNWAKQLHDALKGADDEDKVYLIYGKMNSKAQMSHLASIYKSEFKEGLYSRITSDLSEAEQKKLGDIIKAKPDSTYL